MNMSKHILAALAATVLGLSGVTHAHDSAAKARTQLTEQRPQGADRDARRDWHRDHGHTSGDYRTTQVDRRQARQARRIHAGLRSGDLERSEARRLHRQQRQIARLERRFVSDGHLSIGEWARLDHALDRASAQIYRARHNDIHRASAHHSHAHTYAHDDIGLGRVARTH